MHGWDLGRRPRFQTLGAVTGTTNGTAFTSDGTAGLKGAWVDVGAPLECAAEAIYLFVAPAFTCNWRIDLGVNVAGDRYIVVQDLMLQGRSTAELGWYCALPLHLPAGAQVSVRGASGILGGQTAELVIIAASSGLSGIPGFSRALLLTNVGTNLAGVAVDPGGVANTKTRTELVAATNARATGVLFTIGANNDSSRASNTEWLFDLEIGANGAEQILIPDCYLSMDGATDVPFALHNFWVEIPAGSRITVNCQSDNVTAGDRVFDLSVYGYVP